jgi:Na+/proline symporter
VYTYFGGIRATFLTDYVHTFIIMIILVWFTIKILVIKEIGSIGALYDLVKALSKTQPVEGNHLGSYLTMTSKEAIFFGIIHITYVSTGGISWDFRVDAFFHRTNFGIVFLDTGFWQKVGDVSGVEDDC